MNSARRAPLPNRARPDGPVGRRRGGRFSGFTGLAYAFVCLKAWAGAFAVGSVAQYVGAITALSESVGTLVSTWGSSAQTRFSLRQTFKFLDTPNEMYQGSLTTEKRSDRNYEIEFCDVSFRYPGAEDYALRHVSMKFRIGERLAVVGENGSGKTTFIKLLCRLYDPTEGTILLNGIDIRKYDYDEYIALVLGRVSGFPAPLLLARPERGHRRAVQPRARQGLPAKAASRPPFRSFRTASKRSSTRISTKTACRSRAARRRKSPLARALYKDAPFVARRADRRARPDRRDGGLREIQRDRRRQKRPSTSATGSPPAASGDSIAVSTAAASFSAARTKRSCATPAASTPHCGTRRRSITPRAGSAHYCHKKQPGLFYDPVDLYLFTPKRKSSRHGTSTKARRAAAASATRRTSGPRDTKAGNTGTRQAARRRSEPTAPVFRRPKTGSGRTCAPYVKISRNWTLSVVKNVHAAFKRNIAKNTTAPQTIISTSASAFG